MIYGLLFVDIVLTVLAQLTLRAGALRLASLGFGIPLIRALFRNIYLLFGLFLYGISFFLYVFLLSKLQLSIVYPIATGTILAVITIAAHFIFNESLGPFQVVGIVCIFLGIVLVLLPR